MFLFTLVLFFLYPSLLFLLVVSSLIMSLRSGYSLLYSFPNLQSSLPGPCLSLSSVCSLCSHTCNLLVISQIICLSIQYLSFPHASVFPSVTSRCFPSLLNVSLYIPLMVPVIGIWILYLFQKQNSSPSWTFLWCGYNWWKQINLVTLRIFKWSQMIKPTYLVLRISSWCLNWFILISFPTVLYKKAMNLRCCLKIHFQSCVSLILHSLCKYLFGNQEK